MVIRMADADLLALGAIYEQRRIEWEKANEDLPADETMLEELAKRLGIPLPPPERIASPDGNGGACSVCGVPIGQVAFWTHKQWHVRIMAATKVAGWQANLAHMASQFLALSLRELLEQEEPEEWTPSGHGWIYLQGDPPGSIRARCGGPVMCAKCRADEQHSIAEGDGAAQQYYVRMQEERR